MRGRHDSPRAGRRCSQHVAAVGAFVIGAYAVLNRDKIPGPSQWISLLSAPAEADNKLTFSGERVGRSETAPLLKICVTKDVVRDADSDREIDPAKLFQILASARHADRLTTPRDHGAVELAAKWGAVADCVYRSNSSGLCDIDNRALAVQSANTFLSQADQIASKPENYSANQVEVDSLTQMKSRVLDSMQDLVRNGVLIVSDFTPFHPNRFGRPLPNPTPKKMPALSNTGIASRQIRILFPAAWNSPHIRANGQTPDKPKKDPARPTRAKAARPDDKPTPDTLANLLNPGIGRGTAGLGSGTGLQPPPDNSWDRRRDFSDAHKARKSTPREFNEAPQRDYTASPITGLDPQLAQELGIGDDEASSAPALKKEDPKYRLPRADLPTQPGGFAGIASQQSLEQLLREGRPEFTRARRGRRTGRRGRKNRKAAGAGHRVRFRAEGRPAAGDRGAGRGREAHRPHPGASRRHRLGQDLHHGQGDRGDAAPGADPRAQQDAGGAALWRVQDRSFPTTPSNISSATTTTTSRKPTSRAPTPTSRKNPRSTSRSTACATRRRARCSNATTSSSSRRCRASTASARSKPIRR